MTGTCILARLGRGDQSALIELFTSATEREFLGGVVDPDLAKEKTSAWIERSASEPIWAIRNRESQEFLGYVLLGDHHDGEDIEVSDALLHRHWGHGHATKALKEALSRAYAEYGLKEVVAERQAGNLRSIRLLHRVGMVAERNVIRFGVEQIIFRWKLGGLRDNP